MPASEYVRNPFLYIGLIVLGFASCLYAAEPDHAPDATADAEINAEPVKVKEQSVEREMDAGEDPLESTIIELKEKPFHIYRDHTSFKLYGSARFRYIENGGGHDLNDGGSRAGASVELQLRPRIWVLGRAELGFNVFDTLGHLFSSSDRLQDTDAGVSPRLLYAGLQSAFSTLSYGKNWSSYYQVSGITDRFATFGGDASGTFNALTDGGLSGTGRADNVLQGRFSGHWLPESWNLKPFKLNVQWQNGQNIPQVDGAEYKHTFGLSAVLEFTSEKLIGIAYNQASIDDEDLSTLRKKGMEGDSRALIIGSRRFGDKYYLGTTIARLENQETTDTGTYFDGWGWELFGSYNLIDRWWVVGGWNILEPDHKQPLVGDYRLRYGVLGLRYTFDEFRQMVYSEVRLDDSLTADGSRLGNIYTLGVRWDIP